MPMGDDAPSRRGTLSRRAMLGAGLAGAWASGRSWRLPAAEELRPLSFVIVSDTHLGRNDNDAAERQWRRAVEEINQTAAEFVLHLGDIVDSGREAQYPIYLETKRSLNKPLHEIPGNHDPDELFRRHVRDEVDQAIDYGELRFLLLDNAHDDSHDGFLTGEQLDWLDRQCAAAVAAGRKIVIACHVPIHANRHPDRGWYVKPESGQTAFYALQERHAPHLLACLHGHFHNGLRGWRDHGRLVEALCPSVCYNQDRGLVAHLAEGRASGFYVDELRPGYLLATLGAGRLTLRYKPLGADSPGQYEATWP